MFILMLLILSLTSSDTLNTSGSYPQLGPINTLVQLQPPQSRFVKVFVRRHLQLLQASYRAYPGSRLHF